MSRKPSLLNAIIVHRIEKTIIFKENLAYVTFLLYLCTPNNYFRGNVLICPKRETKILLSKIPLPGILEP